MNKLPTWAKLKRNGRWHIVTARETHTGMYDTVCGLAFLSRHAMVQPEGLPDRLNDEACLRCQMGIDRRYDESLTHA
jgi:hypothetical protein